MIVRTNADGAKIIIPDGNITRKLNALAKFNQNRVINGLWVKPSNDTAGNNIEISAGQAIVNNTYVNTSLVATINIGTYAPTYPWVTVYIATGSSTPTYKFSAVGASYPPGSTATEINGGILLAHIKNNGTTMNATMIDNQVRPKLFSDLKTWDKRVW